MSRINGPTTELAIAEKPTADLVRNESQLSYADIMAIATEISKSGCFRSGNKPMSPQEVFVLMQIGRARGIPMIDALLQYDIIEGRPAIKARTLLARFLEAGGKATWLETSEDKCLVEFSHPVHQPKPIVVERLYRDFEERGITKGYEGKVKKNWRESPAQMLIARACSFGINLITPGVSVGIPVAEEVDAIEVTATPAAATHAKLTDQLKARIGKPTAPEPVVDVESKPAAEGSPRKPERASGEPTTEWGRWIKDRVDVYNSERGIYSAAEPTRDDLKKPIHPNQVISHVAKTAIGEEKLGELQTDGKQDRVKVAAFVSRVWEADREGVEELVDDYLDGLFVGLGFERNVFSKQGGVPQIP